MTHLRPVIEAKRLDKDVRGRFTIEVFTSDTATTWPRALSTIRTYAGASARCASDGPFLTIDIDILTFTTANISIPPTNTAQTRSPAASIAPPPPSPLPQRWSLTNRVFNFNPLRSLYQGSGPRRFNPLYPVNSSPRTLAIQQHPPTQPPPTQRDEYPNLPVEQAVAGERDEYPLLTLPQQRQSRQSSLLVERSTGEDSIAGRTSIALPRDRRSLQAPTPGKGKAKAAMAPAEDATTAGAQHNDVEANVMHSKEHGPSRVSLPDSRRTSMHSGRSGQEDGDTQSEFAWGPSHPCFPHPNPHVPLKSELYDNTRIVRIKRDWMMRGDLAPTFANLYPEVLDPLVSEDDFRVLIKKINDTLTEAFDPFTFRAWLDAVLGAATFWIWDDVGMTGVKRKLADLERWIEDWNRDVGQKEAVQIIPLRRTGYLTVRRGRIRVLRKTDSSSSIYKYQIPTSDLMPSRAHPHSKIGLRKLSRRTTSTFLTRSRLRSKSTRNNRRPSSRSRSPTIHHEGG